jgi:hypothetical protein
MFRHNRQNISSTKDNQEMERALTLTTNQYQHSNGYVTLEINVHNLTITTYTFLLFFQNFLNKCLSFILLNKCTLWKPSGVFYPRLFSYTKIMLSCKYESVLIKDGQTAWTRHHVTWQWLDSCLMATRITFTK